MMPLCNGKVVSPARSTGLTSLLTLRSLEALVPMSMKVGKDLVAASATPLILAIVSEEPAHGYAILQRVGELSGGALQWSDGMLYPVLHRLERQGFIKGQWERSETGRRRKVYRITRSGTGELVEQRAQWEAVNETLRGIWSAFAAAPPRRAAPVHAPTPAPAAEGA